MKIFDAVVILSHRKKLDGNFSKEYYKRLAKGIEFFLNGIARNLILCSETAVDEIREYLEEKDIPSQNIYLQTKSRDSIGEAFFTKKDFLLPNNWYDIIVVSSDYHITYRIKTVFDFINGENFHIKYVGITSGRINDYETKRDQEKSLESFEKLFEKIKRGNDEEIERVLYKNHVQYNGEK